MYPWICLLDTLKPTQQKRNLCVFNFIFQLHSIPCPAEVPLSITSCTGPWASLGRAGWSEPHRGRGRPCGVKAHSSNAGKKSTCPGAWAFNNTVWQGWCFNWPFFLKILLCKFIWIFRILQLEGTLHGSPERWVSFLNWCQHQDLISSLRPVLFYSATLGWVHLEMTLALLPWEHALGLGT